MIGRRLGISLAVASFVLFAIGSYAVAGPRDSPGEVPQTKKFEARLNGFQETPSVSSTGFGNFEAELVNPTTLHYVFHYEGLEGGSSLFAHVHFGQRSVAGGVSFFLCGGNTKPAPCPNVEGTVEGDVTPADIVGPNGQGIEPMSFGEILRAMRAGHSYANIHTTRWPGGELRGQINDNDQREFDK
jgi:CHRD domain